MSVLVTGVSGLVGVNTASALIRSGQEVVGLSRSGVPDLARRILPLESLKEEHGDVLDFDTLMRVSRDHRVTRIIHAAAVTGSSQAAHDPRHGLIATNVLGTANVLEVARRLNMSRVVYTSSSAVYGSRLGTKPKPIREEEVNPQNLYGETKWMGEVLGLRYRKSFGLDFVVARLFSVYGPFQKPRGLDVGYGIVDYLCHAALEGRPVHLPSAGDYYRGYTFVEDAADGLCSLLFAPELAHVIYNIASGKSYTVKELASTISKLVPDADIKVGNGLWENGPPGASSLKGPLDITRARQDFGFEPKYTLEEGVRLYVEHLQRVRAWNTSGEGS